MSDEPKKRPHGKRGAWASLLIALLGFVAGCAPGPSSEVPKPSPETKILEIAKRAVAVNATWRDQAQFDAPIQNPDGSWTVFVWIPPEGTGEHRLIAIDKKGRATFYCRGLD